MVKKQEVYWFRHDGNARRDQKILEMRLVYGAEGIGGLQTAVQAKLSMSCIRLSGGINGERMG